jgi:hypothetical protein
VTTGQLADVSARSAPQPPSYDDRTLEQAKSIRAAVLFGALLLFFSTVFCGLWVTLALQAILLLASVAIVARWPASERATLEVGGVA